MAVRAVGEGNEGFLASVYFVLGEPSYEEWEERTQRSEEYQSGMRLGEHHAQAEAHRRWEDAETSVREAGRGIDRPWREVWDAWRDLEQRLGQVGASSRAEDRVERAYRGVRDREYQLNRRMEMAERYLLEARRIPIHLDEPVISEHVYEVALRGSRMTASVRLQLMGPGNRP